MATEHKSDDSFSLVVVRDVAKLKPVYQRMFVKTMRKCWSRKKAQAFIRLVKLQRSLH